MIWNFAIACIVIQSNTRFIHTLYKQLRSQIKSNCTIKQQIMQPYQITPKTGGGGGEGKCAKGNTHII